MLPNRIAVYLTALSGIAGAVAVPVANLDTRSTAGIVAGLATILGVAYKWLDGWQKHEQKLPATVEDALGTINDVISQLTSTKQEKVDTATDTAAVLNRMTQIQTEPRKVPFTVKDSQPTVTNIDPTSVATPPHLTP